MDKNQKIGFGLSQVSNPTPEFANWIFRGWFIISKALIGWISAVHLFSPDTIDVVIKTVTLLVDPIMYGCSKMFGVETDDNPDAGQKSPKADTPVLIPPVKTQ